MERTRACFVSDLASPSALEASSTVPNASMRGSSLAARPPPSKPVLPSSPVPASSSILFLRVAGTRRLPKDSVEVVQLLRHPPGFFDHVRDWYNLDVAIAPDRDDPTLAADDQLDSRDSEAGRPYAIDRAGRTAALEMPEHGDSCFNTGVPVDAAGEHVADAALGQPDVAERIFRSLPLRVFLELWNVRTLGDDDDAEQLALASPAVEVSDHLGKGYLELGDDDQVGAARNAALQRHPSGVSAHHLNDHHAVVG